MRIFMIYNVTGTVRVFEIKEEMMVLTSVQDKGDKECVQNFNR